jgi:hypothetical protein
MIEFEQSPENVLALSIFLPIFLENHNANLVAYQLSYRNVIKRVLDKIQFRFSTTYKLIGNKHVLINLKNSKENPVHQALWKNIQDGEALEIFEHLGIRIGDLIYDQYLATCNAHTFNKTDPKLEEIFYRGIKLLEWWINFKNTHVINAFIVSHDVYLVGITARLATSIGIPVFLVSTTEIIRLSQKYTRVGADIPLYPQLFLEQPLELRSKGVAIAREKIHNRIKGVGLSDLNYFPSLAFNELINNRSIFKATGRKRILIAAHDFYDSPHVGKIHFYPDFYLWLLRLSEIARETECDWYIKTHPYLRGRGREILENFVADKPNFELLPSNISHNEIITNGIDLALTVYGTIATEYPLLGVRVLNASAFNPHAVYQFSTTPQDRAQYEAYLKDINSIPPVSNTEQIYEYYFMRHLLPLKNWLFKSNSRYRQETGFGLYPMSSEIYTYFLTTENLIPYDEIKYAITCFLNSEAYQLGRVHFREFIAFTESE